MPLGLEPAPLAVHAETLGCLPWSWWSARQRWDTRSQLHAGVMRLSRAVVLFSILSISHTWLQGRSLCKAISGGVGSFLGCCLLG